MEDMSLESNTSVIMLCEWSDVVVRIKVLLWREFQSWVLNCSLPDFSLVGKNKN